MNRSSLSVTIRAAVRIAIRAATAAMLVAALAHAQDLDSQQEARYRNLTQQLRCLVCQNQNIADSNAPLAEDLRNKVRSQILAGRSDADILGYLTARYGDFVLYRPRFKGNTALLWLAPALLVIGGVIVALRLSRRRAARVEAPVDRAALERVLKSEDGR